MRPAAKPKKKTSLRHGDPQLDKRKASLKIFILELDRLDIARERCARQALKALEAFDPDLAKHAIETFGDRARAADWLSAARTVLRGRSPLQAIAAGKRDARIRDLESD